MPWLYAFAIHDTKVLQSQPMDLGESTFYPKDPKSASGGSCIIPTVLHIRKHNIQTNNRYQNTHVGLYVYVYIYMCMYTHTPLLEPAHRSRSCITVHLDRKRGKVHRVRLEIYCSRGGQVGNVRNSKSSVLRCIADKSYWEPIWFEEN